VVVSTARDTGVAARSVLQPAVTESAPMKTSAQIHPEQRAVVARRILILAMFAPSPGRLCTWDGRDDRKIFQPDPFRLVQA
jgi:hypothetical protein